jgi:hypothetical protein
MSGSGQGITAQAAPLARLAAEIEGTSAKRPQACFANT